ncbi:hypothetical protein QBC38DRAFT_505153 [Podospora fimiseda]|uniref:Uncharacterized protein n=1 Tax=Podospora fimiseda TaxID=252190 RepID=A0AAN6YKT1_9PEZI|nr:hypothetical protein QBC38DRAFT_505153 [Podospora fimiseda]
MFAQLFTVLDALTLVTAATRCDSSDSTPTIAGNLIATPDTVMQHCGNVRELFSLRGTVGGLVDPKNVNIDLLRTPSQSISAVVDTCNFTFWLMDPGTYYPGEVSIDTIVWLLDGFVRKVDGGQDKVVVEGKGHLGCAGGIEWDIQPTLRVSNATAVEKVKRDDERIGYNGPGAGSLQLPLGLMVMVMGVVGMIGFGKGGDTTWWAKVEAK